VRVRVLVRVRVRVRVHVRLRLRLRLRLHLRLRLRLRLHLRLRLRLRLHLPLPLPLHVRVCVRVRVRVFHIAFFLPRNSKKCLWPCSIPEEEEEEEEEEGAGNYPGQGDEEKQLGMPSPPSILAYASVDSSFAGKVEQKYCKISIVIVLSFWFGK